MGWLTTVCATRGVCCGYTISGSTWSGYCLRSSGKDGCMHAAATTTTTTYSVPTERECHFTRVLGRDGLVHTAVRNGTYSAHNRRTRTLSPSSLALALDQLAISGCGCAQNREGGDQRCSGLLHDSNSATGVKG